MPRLKYFGLFLLFLGTLIIIPRFNLIQAGTGISCKDKLGTDVVKIPNPITTSSSSVKFEFTNVPHDTSTSDDADLYIAYDLYIGTSSVAGVTTDNVTLGPFQPNAGTLVFESSDSNLRVLGPYNDVVLRFYDEATDTGPTDFCDYTYEVVAASGGPVPPGGGTSTGSSCPVGAGGLPSCACNPGLWDPSTEYAKNVPPGTACGADECEASRRTIIGGDEQIVCKKSFSASTCATDPVKECSELERTGYKDAGTSGKCTLGGGVAGYRPCTTVGAVACHTISDDYKCMIIGKRLGHTATSRCDIAGSGDGVATAIGCVPTKPALFMAAVLRLVTGAAGGIALFLMILGAFQMITSAGNPEQLKNGREQFVSAVVGLLFIVFSVLLLEIIGVDLLGIPGFGT